MNNLVIKGRLTKDPVLKSVEVKGETKSICSFDVAVDKSFGDGADFFNCQIWGKRAEFVDKFFLKGKEILVQGSHEARKYKDKEGNERTIWELKANQVEFCGGKNDGGSSSQTPAAAIPEGFTPIEDDDIPF